MYGIRFKTAHCLLSVSGRCPRRSLRRFIGSFFFGRPGVRLVLFDNERGKGDHKHIWEIETSYYFESVEKLTADFLAAVRAVQAEEEGR